MKELIFTALLIINSITPSFSQCWSSISGGGYDGVSYALSIKSDGTLWQIGNSSYLPNTPFEIFQIGVDNNWQKIFAGYQDAYALKSDSTLWGIQNLLFMSIPIVFQIGSDSDWVTITDGYAIKSNGTLWNLAQGLQVGLDTNWRYVSASEMDWIGHFHAIKTDGTLWGWGRNQYGCLGDGTTIDRIDPVQIGLDSNWNTVTGGEKSSFGLRNDGTLWAWGWNSDGQLGDGTMINRFSPTQIGNDTDWTSVVSKYHHSLALKSNNTLWMWGGSGFTNNAFQTPTLLNENENWTQIGTGGANLTIALNSELELWNFSQNPEPAVLVNCISLNVTEGNINENFLIYPNPFSKSITVDIPYEINVKGKKIKIANIYGEIVYLGELNNNVEQIELPFLSKGIYFLSIQSQNGNNSSHKILVN